MVNLFHFGTVFLALLGSCAAEGVHAKPKYDDCEEKCEITGLGDHKQFNSYKYIVGPRVTSTDNGKCNPSQHSPLSSPSCVTLLTHTATVRETRVDKQIEVKTEWGRAGPSADRVREFLKKAGNLTFAFAERTVGPLPDAEAWKVAGKCEPDRSCSPVWQQAMWQVTINRRCAVGCQVANFFTVDFADVDVYPATETTTEKIVPKGRHFLCYHARLNLNAGEEGCFDAIPL